MAVFKFQTQNCGSKVKKIIANQSFVEANHVFLLQNDVSARHSVLDLLFSRYLQRSAGIDR